MSAYAVIQIVDPYRPEGREDRPETTEFVHWIYETRQEACANRAKFLLHYRFDRPFLVREVEVEPWSKAPAPKKEVPTDD